MNEPFVGGDQATVQDSHEQAHYKIKHIYGLTAPEASLETQKLEWQDSLWQQVQGHKLDVNTLVVTQSAEVSFGLDVLRRKVDCAVFTYEIERFVCFSEFAGLCRLPPDCAGTYDRTRWLEFIEEHQVMQLNILAEENDQNWQYTARKQCDAFATVALSANPSERKTICFSRTDLLESKFSFLFLVNRSTEVLGDFIESDFVLLQIQCHDEPEQKLMPQARQTRALQGASAAEGEFEQLQQRVRALEQELAEKDAYVEQLEKVKRDRERQAHQDKKAIEFLEGDKKRSRGEVQETRELLDQKETEIRNKAKELESRVIELKSLEARFAKI